jgi:hypothetical protein
LGLFEEFYCKGQRWRVQALPAQPTFGSNVELMFILCRRDFQISFLNDSEIPHFLWSQLLGRWKQEDYLSSGVHGQPGQHSEPKTQKRKKPKAPNSMSAFL